MPRPRQILFPLLAVALALALAAALAEIGLRVAGRGQPEGRPTAVDQAMRAWRGLGPDFRGEPPPRPKRAAHFRLVALGDSFTWGAGVWADDAWPHRLARLIRREQLTGRLEVERPIEIVSWSRPGWNTDQAVASLDRFWSRAAPDLVVVGYCLNDAEPSDVALRKRQAGHLEPRDPEGRLSRWLAARSRLFAALFRSAENLRLRRDLAAYYRGLYEQPGWPVARGALERLVDLGRDRGFGVLLVIFPIFDGDPGAGYRYEELHRRVREAAGELELEVLDLLPAYRGVPGERLAVEPFTDPHPNELAHRLAAQAIFERLLGDGRIPARRPQGSGATSDPAAASAASTSESR